MENVATPQSAPQPSAPFTPGSATQRPQRARDEPRQEVRLHGERETWHWCRHFHCTEERLREAIDRVGPDVEALRRELL